MSVNAGRFVGSKANVITAGAAGLGMNCVEIDNSGDTSIPLGTLQKFGTASAVVSWYGVGSVQAALASTYFSGFNGSSQIPSALYFAQYNVAPAAGWLRSGSLSGTTLAQLQALSGTLTLAIDGVSHTSAAINLASATSFSNVAALIQAGIQGSTPSSTATCSYDSLRQAFVVTSGTTGNSSAVAFPTAGTLATGLLLTQATGAVLSPGAAAATPAGVMTKLYLVSQDWATFTTVVDPDAGAAGGPIKQQFAQWCAAQNDSVMYVAYDSDPTPANTLPDASCFAQQVAGLDGTFPIWSTTQGAQNAAFVCGLVASINFTEENGRVNFAFRSSPSLSPDVTDDTIFGNVTGDPRDPGNGYNSYCKVGTRTAQYSWLQLGSVTGAWKWASSYINQIYWNSQFQNDFAVFLSNNKNVPYAQIGYSAIRSALQSDIDAMGSFGAWVAGGTLSSAQANEVNTDSGLNIAPTIETQGWYLLVQDPGPSVRAVQGSPTVKFYYFDGLSVGSIFMTSTDLE